jgi:predicted aspartyl protease
VVPFTAGQPIQAAVRLNGVTLTLVLDTGADRTVISPGALARAGLDPERGRVVQIVGATGRATARELVLERLDLAGTQVGPLAVVVHDIGLAGVDGLLGRDVLDAFTLTVDPAAGHAVLTPSEGGFAPLPTLRGP